MFKSFLIAALGFSVSAALPIQSDAFAEIVNNIIQNDDETDLINQLPLQYQSTVKENLTIAGENKSQLLLAIKNINKKYIEGLAFILAYMPSNDLKQISADFLIENITLAYSAIEQAPWSEQIPHDIFLNNILPYVNVTETRENWRKDFYGKFFTVAEHEGDISNAVKKLNGFVFDTFNVKYHAFLRKKPDQSPYESIAIGYASCTGLSILITDVLRSVGIPARLVGIPSWSNTGGNHTWVEVWDNGWHYIEAASPGNYDNTWFSAQAAEANPESYLNSIYAVSYQKTSTLFPLVWDNRANIYAENVTLRYKKHTD